MKNLTFLLIISLCFMTALPVSAQDSELPENLEPITAENVAHLQQLSALPGHEGGVAGIAINPDSTVLALSSYDDNYNITLGLCDVATGEELLTEEFEVPAYNFTFSPDGEFLAYALGTNVVLRDSVTAEEITVLESTADVANFAFSPDGSLLAMGNYESGVQVWDIEAQEQIAQLQGNWYVAFSPDSTLVATGGVGVVHLWDIETEEEIATLDADGGWITHVTFSPDGTLLAASDLDRIIHVWDLETGDEVDSWTDGSESDIASLFFSPDGSLLISVASGSIINISSDGSFSITIVSYEEVVRLWDVATGEELFALPVVPSLHPIINAEGTLLVTTTEDGEILLWGIPSE